MAVRIEGVGAQITREVEKIVAGGSFDQELVHGRRHVFWHRRNIASVVGGADIEFFNEDRSSYVTNWSRGLPNDQVFVLQAVRFGVFGGYQVDGTAVAATDPYAAAALTSLQAAADRQVLIENGLVNMKINDRDIVQDIYGLYNFPQGGGAVLSSAIGSSSATNGPTLASVSNGEAHNGNAWLVEPVGGWYIAPKEDISLKVKYPFSRTLAGGFVMMAALVGVFITKR